MLKSLVNEGVKLGFTSLVDPNSITIDIDPILAGVKADTDSIGVIKVEVRQAKRSSPSITGNTFHEEISNFNL
jgi:Ca2+-dependent lipid-binding protein